MPWYCFLHLFYKLIQAATLSNFHVKLVQQEPNVQLIHQVAIVSTVMEDHLVANLQNAHLIALAIRKLLQFLNAIHAHHLHAV